MVTRQEWRRGGRGSGEGYEARWGPVGRSAHKDGVVAVKGLELRWTSASRGRATAVQPARVSRSKVRTKAG